MLTVYKLTDQNGYTRRGQEGETLWGKQVTHTASVPGNALCTSQVIHAYRHPLLALLLNPVHAGIKSPQLWEALTPEIVAYDGLKLGVKSLTTTRKMFKKHPISAVQHVRFAIGCALSVYSEPNFVSWAHNWLDGTDRSVTAASAARAAAAVAAANTAGSAAANAAAAAAANAAAAAAAANAAAAAAANANAARYVAANANAARYVAAAAGSAANATATARYAAADADMLTIAKWAMTDSITPPITKQETIP